MKRLKENCIRISMSRKGNPYDKAFAESYIKTIKYHSPHTTLCAFLFHQTTAPFPCTGSEPELRRFRCG